SRRDAHRLVHDPLPVGIVLHLHVADERKVLAEGMPDEAVVGEQAAQVRVTAEQNAEQVEGLALEPVGARPYVHYRIDDRLGGVFAPDCEPQPLVVADGEQLIDDREAAGGVRVGGTALRLDLQGESFVELAQALSHSSSDYRAIVLVRAIFFCSCMIPYTSASAVGGHPGT